MGRRRPDHGVLYRPHYCEHRRNGAKIRTTSDEHLANAQIYDGDGLVHGLAGGLLYWHDSNGFSSTWMASSTGIGFGIGAGFGLIAFVFGVIFGATNSKLGEIGAQIQGQPTAEQLAQIQVLQKRINTVSPIHVYSMLLAMTFMATARHFVF